MFCCLLLLSVLASVSWGKHCQPQHPFTSYIILHQYEAGKAGISDRGWIFAKIANVAATLGARLVITPPFTLLSAVHNNGKEIDPASEWPDYLNAVFTDGSPAIIDSRQFASHGVTFNYELLLAYKPGHRVDRNFYEIDFHHHRNGTINIDGNAFQGYRTALTLFRAGIPFHWHVHGNYYDVARQLDALMARLAPENDPDCNYHSFSQPTKVSAGALQFAEKHKLVKRCFLAMHLRRGDIVGTHEECKNTPPIVRGHVACALQNFTDTEIPLVIFTNGDPEYIEKVVAAVSEVYPGHVFSGEETLTTMAKDNFLAFGMSQHVRGMAFATLAMERSNCHPCPPLRARDADFTHCHPK